MLFRVKLKLLAKGGRKFPIPNYFRPDWSDEAKDPKQLACGGILLMKYGLLAPGQECHAIIVPLVSESWTKYGIGDILYCYQGPQQIGCALIERIYQSQDTEIEDVGTEW